MTFRDVSDWLWPTLAPHDGNYVAKRDDALKSRIGAGRSGCGHDQAKRKKYFDGVREEFADESRRRESVIASLRVLFGVTGAVATLVVGLAVWVVQSHTLNVTTISAVVMLVFATYPVLQFVGALRAVILGMRVRPFQSEPHTARAFGDTMDVAEETLRANRFNEDQTNDRVSCKKLAIRFLQNACLGLIPLVLGIVVVALRNFAAK